MHEARPLLGVAQVAGRMDRVTFMARLDDKFFGELPIGKSGQAEHARRVGCRRIAAELTRKAVK